MRRTTAIFGVARKLTCPTRLAHYDAYKAFLSATSFYDVSIVMSGPLVSPAGTMIGSLFVVEAPDINAVTRFNAEDPFAKAGV